MLIIGNYGFVRITSVTSRVACSLLFALSKPVHPHLNILPYAQVEMRGVEPLSRTPPARRSYNHVLMVTKGDARFNAPRAPEAIDL